MGCAGRVRDDRGSERLAKPISTRHDAVTQMAARPTHVMGFSGNALDFLLPANRCNM
jgi:hypothetical protein